VGELEIAASIAAVAARCSRASALRRDRQL